MPRGTGPMANPPLPICPNNASLILIRVRFAPAGGTSAIGNCLEWLFLRQNHFHARQRLVLYLAMFFKEMMIGRGRVMMTLDVYIRHENISLYKKLLADRNILDVQRETIGKMLAEEEANLLNLFSP